MSRVSAIWECPSRSCTIVGSTPFLSKSVAQVVHAKLGLEALLIFLDLIPYADLLPGSKAGSGHDLIEVPGIQIGLMIASASSVDIGRCRVNSPAHLMRSRPDWAIAHGAPSPPRAPRPLTTAELPDDESQLPSRSRTEGEDRLTSLLQAVHPT